MHRFTKTCVHNGKWRVEFHNNGLWRRDHNLAEDTNECVGYTVHSVTYSLSFN